MTQPSLATVLVIDDEPQIRRFLSLSLGAQGMTVIEAGTGRAGLERMADTRTDLVVLDLGLPDMDGQQVLRKLRARWSMPVIVLSVRSSETEKVAALDGGANDYVTKPFGMLEFSARLRALLRHAVPTEPDAVIDAGRLRIDLGRRSAALDGEPVGLSKKEWALLAMLCQRAGRVVTQAQLLGELWGPTHLQDTHYLRILVAKLRTKLGDDATSPRYIVTEPGVGLRFAGSDDRP